MISSNVPDKDKMEKHIRNARIEPWGVSGCLLGSMTEKDTNWMQNFPWCKMDTVETLLSIKDMELIQRDTA